MIACMSVDVDESDLLQNCPFCDYSLKGLPAEHRCPECGKPFDRRWRLFGDVPSSYKRRPWVKIWVALGIGYLCFAQCVMVIEFISRFDGASSPPSIPTIGDFSHLLSPIVILTVAYIFYRRYGRRFVAVGPCGIVKCRKRRGTIKHYTWAEVGRAKLHMNDVLLEIKHCSMPVLLVRMGTTEAGHCVNYINNIKRPDETG
jgi:hypothetical protein